MQSVTVVGTEILVEEGKMSGLVREGLEPDRRGVDVLKAMVVDVDDLGHVVAVGEYADAVTRERAFGHLEDGDVGVGSLKRLGVFHHDRECTQPTQTHAWRRHGARCTRTR